MRHLLICFCLLAIMPLGAAEGPRVATIDLEAFLKNANLLVNRYAKLQVDLDGYNDQFKDMANRIKKLETRIGMTDKGDAGYDVLVQDMETAKLRLQLAQRQAKERLEGQKKQMLHDSINEAMGLLDAYCNEEGIDIVLQVGGTEEQREVPIAEMAVLYSSPRFDITESFLAYANAKTISAADAALPAAGDSTPVLESLDEDKP